MLKVETGQELSKALVQPTPTIDLYWVIECRGFWFYYKEVPTTENIGANKLKKTRLLQKHQQGGNNSMPEEKELISQITFGEKMKVVLFWNFIQNHSHKLHDICHGTSVDGYCEEF